MARRFPIGHLRVFLPGTIVTIALVIAVSMAAPERSTAAGDCAISTNEAALDASEQEMLRLINEYRTQNGRPALASSAALNKAAARKAKDMADTRTMSHTTSWGGSFVELLRLCGYGYYPAGENIAYGTGPLGSTQSIFNGWRNSPGHNANMLNGSYRAAGIGRACSGTACYWALELGGVADGGDLSVTQQTSPPPTQQVSSPQNTNTLTNLSYGSTTPTYYTYSTMPASLLAQLLYRTFWVYSNGRWYAYNPYRLSASDTFTFYPSGYYYFFR